jgi:hypothetical protein
VKDRQFITRHRPKIGKSTLGICKRYAGNTRHRRMIGKLTQGIGRI